MMHLHYRSGKWSIHLDGASCQADPERGDTLCAMAHRLPRHCRGGRHHLPCPVKLRVYIDPGSIALVIMSP